MDINLRYPNPQTFSNFILSNQTMDAVR